MNHMKAEHSRVPSSMIEACKNKKKRELAKKVKETRRKLEIKEHSLELRLLLKVEV